MYAVIKTGGKQYRVQPGDLLVVEKLEGDVGAEIAFNEILMLGDDGATHLGAPLIDGGVVRATLVETRKGRQGAHRQEDPPPGPPPHHGPSSVRDRAARHRFGRRRPFRQVGRRGGPDAAFHPAPARP